MATSNRTFREENLKVLIAFRTIGPYHVARLAAAAAHFPRLVALESTNRDAVNAWRPVGDRHVFQKRTLFRDRDSLDADGREVRARTRSALDDIAPDVVFVHGWSEKVALCITEWCLDHHVPRVVMSESQEIDRARNPVVEAVKSSYVRAFDAAVCGGRSHAAYLVKLGMPRDRIFLGYDVVDNDYFSAGAVRAVRSASELRLRYGLPEQYFLCSSRFVEKKNLFRLLDAYGIYLATAGRPAWKLVMLGDGELRAQIVDRVSQLQLSGHVLMPGFQQYAELPVYYALAGAFIHASTVEQWGLVVNEAMACGLPVVVSHNAGCAHELVRGGFNGYLFNPYDVEGLAGKLVQIAGDDQHRRMMGDNSREIVSGWSTARFGSAVESAVRISLEGRRQEVGLMQRLAIKGMYLK